MKNLRILLVDDQREIIQNTPGIPVVITTLYEYPEVLRQAQKAGRWVVWASRKRPGLLIPVVKSAIDHHLFFPPLS